MRKYLGVQKLKIKKMADCDDYDPHIDFRKLKETHETAGYREGLEAGEEITLQAGFDEGFTWGTSYSVEWAKLRGILSALLSYVSSKNDQNKDEVIGQLTEVLKEAQKLEEMVNMDNLILSAECISSKMIEQRNSNQGINTTAKQECCDESCNTICGEETREVKKEGCGRCCQDVNETQEKSCSSELQPGTVDKTDKSLAEISKTVLPISGPEVQNLLLKCKSIVSDLGLNPDTILSPLKHLMIGQ